MRTTSYEISKKLAEIGFFANEDTIFWYDKNGNLNYDQAGITLTREQQAEAILAYDLETILEALPDIIHNNEELKLQKTAIGYYFQDDEQIVCLTGVYQDPSESLADTAARLLILLHEKGIVKFNN